MSRLQERLNTYRSLDLKLTEIKIKRSYKETSENESLYELAVINMLKNCMQMARLYAEKGKECSKQKEMYDELLMWILEVDKYQRSSISCQNPNSLPKEVMERFREETTVTIHVGGYGHGNHPMVRFLTTINVLTCITVMAWSPEGKGFATHIPIGSLLQGCRKGEPLKNLTLQLTKTFHNSKNIVVHLIGGHKHSDTDMALQRRYYPDNKAMHSFAWHVENAVRKSGLNDIRKNLLNSFPGMLIQTMEDEINLRKQNQRLNIVAIDLMTGSVMVHSRESEENFVMSYVPEKVINAEILAYRKMSLNRLGNPLTSSSTAWS